MTFKFITIIINSCEGHQLRYAFYEDTKKNKAYDVASTITTPTLIIHGRKDSEVPFEQSEKLRSIIPNAQLVAVENADHWYKGEGEEEQFLQTMHQFVLDHV